MVDMTIAGDTKDWTWVLQRPCPECGLEPAAVDPTTVADRIRTHAGRWSAALAEPAATERPAPGVWSPVEYGAHVRDMYGVFADRVGLMLLADDPEFENWDQDVAAVEGGYERLSAAEVATGLTAAIDRMATGLDAVPAHAWHRTGRRSNGSAFTVATLTQYMLHDDVHHLHDVGA
jgi:hypothetical protein